MSYILDALKKSQRERALGSIPQLDVLAPTASARRGRRIAAVAATAIVLIAAGIAAGIYLGRPAPQPVRDAQAPAATPLPVPTGEAPAAVAQDPVTPERGLAAAEADAALPAPREEAVPLLSDTPLDYQRRVPAMSINVVSYSEVPERRFVMIDLVMYREGQTLPNGATVVAIAADEVTFGFAGRRFRLRP